MSNVRTIVLAAGLAIGLASGADAKVNRFSTTGGFLESGGEIATPMTLKGKFNTKSAKLRARIQCGAGCLLGGRLKADCEVGEGFYFVCAGTVGRRCLVDGILYQSGFEGTFTCDDRSGDWSFGNP